MTGQDWSCALAVKGTTTVVGVIGWPVAHSLSPPMHNAAFAHLKLDWVYVPFPVAPEDIGRAVEGVRALRLAGVNVTIPHKAAVVPYLDELDQTVADLQVANTIHNLEGVLKGYNTDGPGLLRALEEAGCSVRGRRVVVVGAGGAGRAVATAVARAGAASLAILNRTVAKAEELAAAVERLVGLAALPLPLSGPLAQEAVEAAEVVVDSTSVGMYPHCDEPPVISPEWLHPGQVVCDLTYNPRDTVLLKAARARGARTVNGTGMLVHQGAIAFEIWTGQPAPVETMRQALLNALGQPDA